MSEAAIRRDAIADALLELLRLRKAAFNRARPYDFLAQANLVDPFSTRPQRDLRQLLLEGDEQLLRHPGRAQQPATARAIGDRHPRRSALPSDSRVAVVRHVVGPSGESSA